MKNASFYVAYDGIALANNEMNVRDLSPALLALADIFDETNKIVNGGRAKVTLNVKGSFKSGCFGIDFVVVQEFLQSILNFGGSEEVRNALNLLDLIAGLGGVTGGISFGIIKVLKWIKNRKITNIEEKDDKAIISIGSDSITVNIYVIKMLSNEKVRKALEDSIAKPLEQDGIDEFIICEKLDDESNKIRITKKEAPYFIAPQNPEEDLGITEYETQLQIISPTFQENNKWKFNDGTSVFFADIIDKNFLEKVDKNQILFGKGDILQARIEEHKTLQNGQMSTKRTIIKVISHRNATTQLKLIE